MTRRFAFLAFGVFSISALAAPANVFYGASGQGGVASSLYTINPATGATTLVGATGFTGVGSLAVSPAGVLYGIAGNSGSGTPVHRLITINTTTGVGTAVGITTVNSNITDIAFRSDGVLFAMDGSGDLYTVNTTTGAATFINAGTSISSGGGLAFNAGNTLFVANGQTLATVNQSTAVQTPVATLAFVGTTNSLVGMKFDPSGVLYASAWSLDSSTPSQLVTVNTTTGAMTNLGSNVVRLEAIAISGSTVMPPPPPTTPISNSLWLMLTGVFGLAAWQYWKRRSAASSFTSAS